MRVHDEKKVLKRPVPVFKAAGFRTCWDVSDMVVTGLLVGRISGCGDAHPRCHFSVSGRLVPFLCVSLAYPLQPERGSNRIVLKTFAPNISDWIGSR